MEAKDLFQQVFDGYVHSYRSRDAAGCASYFTDNAELYSPYGPAAIGRPAIETTHKEWVEEEGEDKAIEVLHADAEGRIGWCLARFSEGSAASGTSLNVLYQQADGKWLIAQCSLNEAL